MVTFGFMAFAGIRTVKSRVLSSTYMLVTNKLTFDDLLSHHFTFNG